MHFRTPLAGCILALLAAAAHADPTAGLMPRVAFGDMVPGLPVAKHIRSMYDLRYQGVVRQQTDFTCGAAALATILQQVYGRHVGEKDIVNDMLAHADLQVVERQGFSLLDLKRYAERHGLRGHGYRVDASSLLSLKIPVIALQNTNGYAHFVVVKRVHAGLVFIADPVLGNRQMLLDDFLAAWNGIVFAVVGNGIKADNVLLQSARSLGAQQRAAIATRTLPPQQEYGLLGVDSF